MLKTNRKIPNIKEKVGDLMIINETSKKIESINNNDDTIIYHLVSAYEILHKEMELLNYQCSFLESISRKGQALKSINNALHLLSTYNNTKISYKNTTMPPSIEEMEVFLKKWRKRNSSSS